MPPAQSSFPFPYSDDFKSTAVGKTPKYFADQDGAFEAAPCAGRPGQCLRQVVRQRPIAWGRISPDPLTFLGSADWTDYEAGTTAMLEEPGNITLVGRIDSADWFQDGKARWPSGYVLTVQQDGSWELDNARFKTPAAKLSSGKVAFSLKTWHRLALAFRGSTIEASIDGARVASLSDETHKKGMAGIGTGWNLAQFADFAVK